MHTDGGTGKAGLSRRNCCDTRTHAHTRTHTHARARAPTTIESIGYYYLHYMRTDDYCTTVNYRPQNGCYDNIILILVLIMSILNR